MKALSNSPDGPPFITFPTDNQLILKRTMSIASRLSTILALTVFISLVGCDSGSNSDEDCLEVTPGDAFVVSGTAMTTSFAPGSKTYTVRNTCSSSVDISIDEDERWLDSVIVGFSSEAGELAGGGSINVDIGLVSGSDNPERLDQLDAGSYTSDVRFVDESNDAEIVRSVQLTVNAP